MFYFSARALNEIDDARYSTSETISMGLEKGLSLKHDSNITSESPGSSDRVSLALKKAIRSGRQVHRELCNITTGSIFDIVVHNLTVGVMSFLNFGQYRELPRQNRVRVFWAQANILPSGRLRRKPGSELILIGSLDNVVNNSWLDKENAVKIGHEYPSDPSVLSELLRDELELTDDDSVKQHIANVREFEVFDSGCYARCAASITERAHKVTRTSMASENFARSWDCRRPPIKRARVVASVSDVNSILHNGETQTVLARPVYIGNMT